VRKLAYYVALYLGAAWGLRYIFGPWLAAVVVSLATTILLTGGWWWLVERETRPAPREEDLPRQVGPVIDARSRFERTR